MFFNVGNFNIQGGSWMKVFVYCFIGLSLFFIFEPGVKAGKDKSLVLYFMFDEMKDGKTIADLSEHGNNGEIKGKPKVVEGKKGSALDFKAGDYVEVAHSDSLNILEDITIAVWLNHAGGIGTILSKIYSYWLGVNPDIEFAYQKGGANVLPHIGQNVPVGEWAHLAVTQDKSGEILFYLNGKEISKVKHPMPRDASTQPLVIAQGTWGTAPYIGVIDEVRLYNRALSKDEIVKIMTSFGLAVELNGKLSTTWGDIRKL
jgi:hypothetical protein